MEHHWNADEEHYGLPHAQAQGRLTLYTGDFAKWAGYPDETTDFDQAVFVVDYVRVYQKT